MPPPGIDCKIIVEVPSPRRFLSKSTLSISASSLSLPTKREFGRKPEGLMKSGCGSSESGSTLIVDLTIIELFIEFGSTPTDINQPGPAVNSKENLRRLRYKDIGRLDDSITEFSRLFWYVCLSLIGYSIDIVTPESSNCLSDLTIGGHLSIRLFNFSRLKTRCTSLRRSLNETGLMTMPHCWWVWTEHTRCSWIRYPGCIRLP